jgi:hypothetical protein
MVVQCFEGDNEFFLFNADGSGKTRITGPYDYLNYSNYEWAEDGDSFTYQRINSCCLSLDQIPASAPPPGWVRYEIASGMKVVVSSFTTPAELYRVVNVASDDALNMRAGAGVNFPIVGTIPYDGQDIQITGDSVVVGESAWVPVLYGEYVGWINVRYLERQP